MSQKNKKKKNYVFIEKNFKKVILRFLSKKIEYMRKQSRLLSSLMDLKLRESEKPEVVVEEGKRKKQRNGTIKGFADQQIYENFTRCDKKKSLVDKTLILKSLGSHFTFSSLIKDKDIQEILLDKFKLCRIAKEEYLMKQNDPASSFFILHEGELQVQINGKVKRKIESGEGFGELALLYSSPRSASIRAVKPSFLWFIDRCTFRKAISSMIEKNFTETRAFIEKNDFFVYLTSAQKDKIASIAINQQFPKNSKICKEGELASSMYIVKSGVLKKVIDGIEVGKIKAGSFCEQYAALKKNSLRRDTIIVQQDAEVIALGVEDIEQVFGRSLPLIFTRNKVRAALLQNEEFKRLSAKYLDLALDCFKVKNVQENSLLVKEGDHCRNLIFLILEGQYQISKPDLKEKIYGCKSITTPGHEIAYKFKMKFTTLGKIVWASKRDILEAFSSSSYEQSIEKILAIERTIEKSCDRLTEMKSQCSRYALNDFQVITKLGQGQFGTVFLVTEPQKKKQFALKCISKEQTIKNKLEKHVINEKKVLQQITSPFSVHYLRSYKDSNYVYFLTEFINGLELFDVIRIIGILNFEQTQFYGAIMFHFLETMHAKNIIYRDLKPQNVMVSENGYLKFIDMGTCKQLDPKIGVKKTFTIIGTPNYMAPEIISGKGYSFTVDLWSLGIVLYQFMAGYVPFGEEAEDPYEIYQQILRKPLKFPSYMKDRHAIDFIIHLLNKSPDARLNGSYSSLSKHSFFNGVDWEKLIDRSAKPAYLIPKDKLLQIDASQKKMKPLSQCLEQPRKHAVGRKDLNPKWDEIF